MAKGELLRIIYTYIYKIIMIACVSFVVLASMTSRGIILRVIQLQEILPLLVNHNVTNFYLMVNW